MTKSELKDVVIETTKELLGMYKAEVQGLRQKLHAAESRVGYLENTPSEDLLMAQDHIKTLERQVAALRHEINEGVPTPESEKLRKELGQTRVLLHAAAADRDTWAQKFSDLEFETRGYRAERAAEFRKAAEASEVVE